MDAFGAAINLLASRIVLSAWLFTTSLAGIANWVSIIQVQHPRQTLHSAVDFLGFGPEAKNIIDTASLWATDPIRAEGITTVCLLLAVALLGFGMQSSSSYGAASSHALILVSLQVSYTQTFWVILCTLLIITILAKWFPACGRGVLGFLISPFIAIFLAFSWLSGPRAGETLPRTVRVEGPVTVKEQESHQAVPPLQSPPADLYSGT